MDKHIQEPIEEEFIEPTEPSVLDYFKSLFRSDERIKNWEAQSKSTKTAALDEFAQPEVRQVTAIAPGTNVSANVVDPQAEVEIWPDTAVAPSQPVPTPQTPFPWRSLLALLLALLGQSMFEPPIAKGPLGLAFYLPAISVLIWAIWRGEWRLAALQPHAETQDPLTYRRLPLFLSVILAAWAFLILGGNYFTVTNVLVWYFAVMLLVWALWLNGSSVRTALSRRFDFMQGEDFTVHISRIAVALLIATLVAFFFRFNRTTSVPPEPFSDHAEKILDVYEVSQGQTHIFFPRNTGREAIQMYWSVLIEKVFGTGFSFLTLKLGTAILGFLTLPFIYLLGKELGGRRVGFLAFVLVGIGYWPNVISRVGLRFPIYPLFVAPTLYFLIKGFRTRNRNDFLLSGIFLGLGLHGYSPFRIVPIVVVVAFVLYWLHNQSAGVRKQSIYWLIMLGVTAMFVFLPLLRYWYDEPAVFGFRAFTRVSSIEQPLPGPAYQIFASNVWNALKMINFDDGEIWVNSVTHRPAFDRVSATFFLLGVVLVLIRYLRNRNWLDLFLLVSVPLLMLPSILSLAFPLENPALNRAGGAYVPAFMISAIALDGFLTGFEGSRGRKVLAWVMAGLLLVTAAIQNYDLVFNQYYNYFRNSSWNSSDMGQVIKDFVQTNGVADNIWIVPFPYWVDTRLPAVWAGIPDRDLAMWPDNLATTVSAQGPKLFLVKADTDNPDGNDQASLDVLEELYPDGRIRLFDSDVPGHDFWIYSVPDN